jgi:hypothetical protein
MHIPVESDPIHSYKTTERYPSSPPHTESSILQKSGSTTDESKKSSTGLDAGLVGSRCTGEGRSRYGGSLGSVGAGRGSSIASLCGGSVRLCSSYASDGSHGAGSGSAEGLGSIAVRGDGVLDRGLVLRVGAVVVADENITVDVAQADEVVALLVAVIDAGLVAGDASVDDAVGERVVSLSFSFSV